jgi:RNA recognition motif-containing protein
MINLQTGSSKGFGFIQFDTITKAEAAVIGLNGRRIDSKRLLARFVELRENQSSVADVYVKRHVVEHSARFGSIVEVMLRLLDPQLWHCAIRYSCVEEAAAALALMKSQIVAFGTDPGHSRWCAAID